MVKNGSQSESGAGSAASQRRGKTEETASATKQSSASTAATTTTNKSNDLAEHVQRAYLAVLKNKAAVDTLQGQWRLYLLRLSYLLIFVCLHQIQLPAMSCVADIKQWNDAVRETSGDDGLGLEVVTALQAMQIVLRDALTPLMSLVMTSALAFFLTMDPPADFSSVPYMIANACLPIVMGLYFQQSKNNGSSSGTETTLTTAACIDDRLALINLEPNERKKMDFPVVLVFHGIVTACCWFMQVQLRAHVKNLHDVEQLRKDLIGEGQGQSSKKSGSGSTAQPSQPKSKQSKKKE